MIMYVFMNGGMQLVPKHSFHRVSFQRRTLFHDNIVKFVGAVLEPPKLVLLHEYCPKGSLQVSSFHVHFFY